MWIRLILVSLFVTVNAHIRLVYPPARYPALDFIDNVRTPAPCGVPKPASDKATWTLLEAGSVFNVTWFQPFPHHGGYRIELLDADDKLLRVLTPTDGTYFGEDDATTEHFTVSIPADIECNNCAIRLVRQATEWGADYLFYSCADVKIVQTLPSDSCLSHGIRSNGTCQCERLYSGVSCENKDECWSDNDCSANGKCVHISHSSYPHRQCFCKAGYFGLACEQKSQTITQLSEFDESLYRYRDVGVDGSRIHWRIIDDEVEVVLRFVGQSWAAIGWKPSTTTCPSVSNYVLNNVHQPIIPLSEPVPTDDNVSQPMLPPTTSTVQVVAVGTGNATQIQCSSPHEIYAACPDIDRSCEPSCDWNLLNQSAPTNCTSTCGPSRCVCTEGHVRQSNAIDAPCVPFSLCPTVVVHPTAGTTDDGVVRPTIECPSNSTYDECGSACEPTCANMYDTTPCPTQCQPPGCTCTANFVRYNGQCVYWGDCPPEFFPPSAAAFWSIGVTNATTPLSVTTSTDGTDAMISTTTVDNVQTESHTALTCAVNETITECGNVCEPDCLTIFVRPQCDDCSSPSCACIQGYARFGGRCVYWGDCPLNVSGLQTANDGDVTEALTVNPATVVTVIRPVVAAEQTPTPTVVTTIVTDQQDVSDDRAPTVDTETETEVFGDVCFGDWRWPVGCRYCDYKISWNYLDDTDEIEFSIETRAPSNWWTGVGFSSTGTMPTVVGTHVNGVLRAQFQRKRDTGDRAADHRFTDTSCYKFLFPVSGGRLDADGNMTKHLSTPIVSEKKVCIRSCLAVQQPPTANNQLKHTCENEYRYPAGCEGSACDYIAKWEYSATRKDIRFEISAREVGRWTGIGFSRDGSMSNSDIYTGWVYEGRAYVTDRFAYGRQLPAIDPADRQDIYEVGGKIEDDIQTIWFRRKVLTADVVTDFPLNKCYYFLYPIGGGRVLARKGDDFQQAKTPIGYHDLYQPKISRTKICICDSRGQSIAASTEEIKAPGNNRRTKRQQVPAADPFDLQIDPFVDLPPTVAIDTTTSSSDQTSTPTPMTDEPQHESTVTSSQPEPSPEPEPATRIIVQPEPEPTTNIATHPMDCADIVVGASVGGVGQVRDYYTLSRATPQLDEYYGGRQSLTSATAFEQDGMTTVVFRKKLSNAGDETTDHSISRRNQPMTVIWAKGQEYPNYVHNVEPSVFAAGRASSNEQFYEIDVLKYHGAKNRGTLTIDFFEGIPSTASDDCIGTYKYPTDCTSISTCIYILNWQSDGKSVHFSLNAATPPGHWSAVGFSTDGSMVQSHADIIVASVLIEDNNSVTVTDQFAPGYGRPEIDTEQDVFNVMSSYENGRVLANFSRSLEATDKNGDVSLTECQFFLYPTSGGPLEGGSAEIRKHTITPLSSAKKICLHECGIHAPVDDGKKTKPSAHEVLQANVGYSTDEEYRPRYSLVFRILNRDWNDNLSNPDSMEFKQLAEPVSQAVNRILEERYPSLRVSNVYKFTPGSVLAHMEVISTDASQEPTAHQLATAVQDRASAGKVDTLQIEPTTIRVARINKEDRNPSPDDIRNWIIIAVAALLIIMAILLIACLLVRSRRTKSTDLKSNSRYVPFAPYSYMINGAGYPNAAYPVGAFQYPPPTGAPIDGKMRGNKGFENAAYQTAPGGGIHTRQFSQATTASQNGKRSPAGSSSETSPNAGAAASPPAGVGETTYQEWYQKVASNPASQQHHEACEPRMPPPTSRGGGGGRGSGAYGTTSTGMPYVSYPNDPMTYTLNGSRMSLNRPPQPPPPPGYYRPY